MKEIPLYKVRANQVGIVIVLAIAIVMQIPWLVAIVWIVEVLTRLLGANANVFVIAFDAITKLIYGDKHTEAQELQHFNLNIAVIFLTISLLCFSLGWNLAGYIVAGIMLLCSLLALFGFCIGCTMYFQLKKFKALRQLKMDAKK